MISTNFVLQNIKEGIEGRPVSWYQDIFELIFPNLDREQANQCKSCEWKKEHDAKQSDKDE